MSWFDTSQLASIASKAMKEAQKTLDKALDIEGEDQETLGTLLQVGEIFNGTDEERENNPENSAHALPSGQ